MIMKACGTMYFKEDLISDLDGMEIDPKGTLLVHSSMKSIGDVAGGADSVLDALSEYMKDGLLVLPTHSWARIGEDYPVFDVRSEPACVGILPNLFMKRKGVLRSLHPTHSVAALGNDAKDFIEGEETDVTPCPRKGCWGKLYDRDASILFIGCTLKSNTFLHGVEEWNHIPNRISESTQKLTIIDSSGKSYHVDMHRHFCPYTEPSEHYDKAEYIFREKGAIKYGKFGDARCILGSSVMMADICTELLFDDPDYFGKD
jgi:aminoglycoside 3-N-acetyltransferase